VYDGWGKQLVPYPVAVDYPKSDAVFGRVLLGLLVVIFAAIAVGIFLSTGPTALAFGFPLAAVGLFVVASRAVNGLQSRLVTLFDSEGVMLKAGRRLAWSALERVECRTFQQVNRKWVRRLDLVFRDARVFVGWRARNFSAAVELAKRLPVEQKETPLS
jgi:hypothetical protein